MKALFTSLIILFFACSLSAQYCGSSQVSTITPTSVYGFGDPNTFDCISRGTQDSVLINFKCYAQFTAQGNTVTIYKLRIDSIENLPCGMCWSTNKATNEFLPSENGTILIQGLTNDNAGQYKMRIIISVATQNASNYDIININADAGGINEYVRVRTGGGLCDTVNYSQLGNTSSCTQSSVTVTASASTICPGDSVWLAASHLGGYSYTWSTGDTTDIIQVAAAGTYTVTASDGTHTYVSQPVTIAAGTGCGATIIASSATTFCQGGFVTLTASGGVGYTYLWSTGATSTSIVATASGSYSVTAYSGTDTFISAPLPVVVNPLPHAYFTLTPDPNTPHTWIAVNQCTGNNISYAWVWGDHSVSGTGSTPSHTYDSAGYYDICVFLTESTGCSDSYCDSSAHIYKTANQMIQMNVVQYPLGISNTDKAATTVKYYAGAVHFTDAITMPVEARLYDVAGRVILSQSGLTGSSMAVDASVASGIYILVLHDAEYTGSHRISIVR